MTTETLLTEEQLVRQAAGVLIDHLGLVESTRFLALARRGRVESVERHRAWQETLDKDRFFDEVFPGQLRRDCAPGFVLSLKTDRFCVICLFTSGRY